MLSLGLTLGRSRGFSSSNLILNGTFTTDSSNWFANNAVLSTTTFDGVANVLQVADGGGWSSGKQSFESNKNQYYELTAKRHANGILSNNNIFISDGNYDATLLEAVGDIFGTENQASNAVWNNAYIKFKANSKDTTVLLGSAGVNSSYYDDVEVTKKDPLLVAHRGFATYRPENTISAFTNAVALGNKRLEFDVQVSSDGVPVVIHDTTVDRTTDGLGNVADLTLVQLKALDAGTWFNVAYAGEQIPTLAEVLQFAQDNGCSVYPEIKGYRTAADIAIMLSVASAYTLPEIFWQSFVFTDLDTVRADSATHKVGYLSNDMLSIGLAIANTPSGYLANHASWTIDAVRQCRDAGVATMAWTVDLQTDADTAYGKGVEYIMSNSDLSLTVLDSANLVTNGAFDTDLAGWTDVNTYWTWVAGRAWHAHTAVFNAFMTPITAGDNCRLTFDYEVVSGFLAFSQRTLANVWVSALVDRIGIGSGTYTIDFTADVGAEVVAFYRDATGASASSFYIDNVYLEIL